MRQTDNRCRALRFPAARSHSVKGSPKIASSRARALAVAAIREACEETGLCLGRKVDKPVKLEGAWKPFTDAGLLPDPSSLFLIARAITPPGRVRRFDTRFFTADASSIAHRFEGVIHAALNSSNWYGSRSAQAARRRACHDQERASRTRRRREPAPLRHDAAVPFHFYGQEHKDGLGSSPAIAPSLRANEAIHHVYAGYGCFASSQ